ncbi:hypothetical protein WMY93_033460, partial [Mugilogobius chulae]
EDRFAFLAEWFDPSAGLLRKYQLFFYPRDGSVEMYDVKNERVFLRRTKYEDLHTEDLFVGNKVNIFSRQLSLIDYADQFTANRLGSKKERTLALIKPDSVTKIGDVLQTVYSSDLIVTKARMVRLTWSQAADFYVEHQSKPSFNSLVQFLSSGPMVALELMGDEAVSVWRRILGPTDSALARREEPRCVRAQYGTDAIKNVGHGSDSYAAAARELEFFFPSTIGRGPENTAVLTDCTCCVIKPHAVSEGTTSKSRRDKIRSISLAFFHRLRVQLLLSLLSNLQRCQREEFRYIIWATRLSRQLTFCFRPCLVLVLIWFNAQILQVQISVNSHNALHPLSLVNAYYHKNIRQIPEETEVNTVAITV